tara:strand:+ start:1028 stop:1495 length:468 start_codon:yes stop_codon:yes gene_type:complete
MYLIMNFKEQFEKDYFMGKLNEKKLIKYLNDIDPETYYLCRQRYALMDFKKFNDDKFLGELKSRNCKKDKWETAIISTNKIEKAIKDTNGTLYKFYYLYEDGLYYYDFNKEDIDNGIIFKDWWCRYSRGQEEKKMVYYIPRELLTFITDEINSLN